MLKKNEIIDVKSWMELGDCNYEIDHDDDSIPESGVVYCNIEHIHKLFAKCKQTSNKYIVVSAFSDYGVALQEEHPVALDMLKFLPFLESQMPELGYKALQIPPRCELDRCNIEHKYSVKCHSHTYSTFEEIPNNVVKWFTSNAMTKHDKIVNIPLGIGKDSPEPLCSTLTSQLHVATHDRVNLVYANWQDYTYDRAVLRNSVASANFPWVTLVNSPKPYEDYISDLTKHSFALCPEGNGVDCYRMLECLYCGCIPIVLDRISYGYLNDLPCVKLNSWAELNPDILKRELTRINRDGLWDNLHKLTKKFWKSEIDSSKILLEV
jgi:hypothetical protein|tara:strand:- start:533 stop:1501 length:969 start_codon:yes stop_codon:yes gene_type:complete